MQKIYWFFLASVLMAVLSVSSCKNDSITERSHIIIEQSSGVVNIWQQVLYPPVLIQFDRDNPILLQIGDESLFNDDFTHLIITVDGKPLEMPISRRLDRDYPESLTDFTIEVIPSPNLISHILKVKDSIHIALMNSQETVIIMQIQDESIHQVHEAFQHLTYAESIR
ncbi:hypothetical protein PVA45_03160 [Entomospira entomophila]|uniref:Uncharacterized protein n=1 Tax=Entomospira entomophila TaxID=2719988 RepID=A0A968KR99_9SPIO|nr:hypothetical protein [Entomospira entomophilus]NIZ40513.1 hypothetical protein [Entomospira entomophilus]WDI36072.1 hypothetical protein PVA45_03160 [Entomospira entomophilus]